MQLLHVAPHQMDQAWRDGAFLLGDACIKSAGEVTADQLKMRLARGELTLLCGSEDGNPVAWAAVTFEQYPNLRALFVYAIWASGHTSAEAFELLAKYGKEGGASVIRGACDEAIARLWARKFGFTQAYQIMEKSL